jgi:hypothetical protein
MSAQTQPRILTNPQYSTNNVDPLQTGWYQVQPNSSNIALRVLYSNIGLKGEIRLNTNLSPPVFQGNNGSGWDNFTSLQGPTGPAGQDFVNQVNFINLGDDVSAGTPIALAEIFASSYANVAANISNVNIRVLKSGEYDVNSNLSITCMDLTQNSNVIVMTTQPLPYGWDFGYGKNTKTYLKNSGGDSPYYGWGETSTWVVKQGSSVTKGQAVRLTNDTTSSNIVITPVTYTSLSGINPLTTPFNMLGIALESKSAGEDCLVCTKGITTVLCTNNITTDFTSTTTITDVGLDGIVGKDGGIFCCASSPIVDFIRAGYFLETGAGIAGNGMNVLFYVDPEFRNN